MFTAPDRRIVVTDYGEVGGTPQCQIRLLLCLSAPLCCVRVGLYWWPCQPIDPEDFTSIDTTMLAAEPSRGPKRVSAARLLANNAAADDAKALEAGKPESAEAKAQSDVPTKLEPFRERVVVMCRVGYLDMEGLIDGKSMRLMLNNIQPRKLVLVRSTPQYTQDLTDFCKKKFHCEQVFAPDKGECVDMSSNTSIFQASLRDSLFQSLRFRSVRELRGLEAGFSLVAVTADLLL